MSDDVFWFIMLGFVILVCVGGAWFETRDLTASSREQKR